MASRTGIAKLALSGFQIFDELTEIPLERLTLLFGPNSAGKSAVEDALGILEWLWPPEWCEPMGHTPDIMRHWRRTGSGPDGLARRMQVDACFHQLVDIDESFCITTGRGLRDPQCYRAEPSMVSRFELKTTLTLDEEQSPRVQQREVYADDLFLFRITFEREYCLNFEHPALRHLDIRADFHSVAASEFFDYSNGVITLRRPSSPGMAFLQDPRFPTHRNVADFLFQLDGSFEGILERRSALSCEPVIEEFFLFLNTLEKIFTNHVSFHTELVPASRHVPTREDLTFLVPPSSTADSLADFGLAETGDPRYRVLADSFVTSLRRDADATAYVAPGKLEKAFDDVNASLTDHLFIERGYRLQVKYRGVLTNEQIEVLTNNEIDSAHWTNQAHMLVRILLADAQGREFSFEDVGSGLGYVLPVLVAVSIAELAMLQQPELHLHPALQAAMGDVLIDSTKEEGRILAETHSEHLLLRILKRIRQTTNGSIFRADLRVRADEVCVLYFEPMPNGTTTVKRLRIHEDGEFMDRWPRGFFVERDEELFDE